MSLKILLVARSDLFKARGGDSIQIEKLADGLRRLGVCVDVGDAKSDFSAFDLVHVFNLTRYMDSYLAASKCAESGIPYVISPIWHSVSQMADFYFPYFSKPFSNSLLCLYFYVRELVYESGNVFYFSKLPPFQYLSACRFVVNNAAQIQANSFGELRCLEDELGIVVASSDAEIVRCGVLESDADNKINYAGKAICKKIIIAGRIEPRKNIINSILAFKKSGLAELGWELYLAGSVNNRHSRYFDKVRKIIESSSNIKYLGKISQDRLFEYFLNGAICLQASYFETIGLSALESICLGGRAVVTDRTYPDYYFDQFVEFCDPFNVDSIAQALRLESMKSSRYPKERILELNWMNFAKATLGGYRKVL